MSDRTFESPSQNRRTTIYIYIPIIVCRYNYGDASPRSSGGRNYLESIIVGLPGSYWVHDCVVASMSLRRPKIGARCGAESERERERHIQNPTSRRRSTLKATRRLDALSVFVFLCRWTDCYTSLSLSRVYNTGGVWLAPCAVVLYIYIFDYNFMRNTQSSRLENILIIIHLIYGDIDLGRHQIYISFTYIHIGISAKGRKMMDKQ